MTTAAKKTERKNPVSKYKISEFNRDNVRLLASCIVDELQVLADKYDLKIDYRGATFDSCSVKLRLELNTKDKTGKVNTAEESQFKAMCSMYGLKPEHLGACFSSRGERFTITGLNTRRRQYPICAIRVTDGKKFKFGVSQIKLGLGIPQF